MMKEQIKELSRAIAGKPLVEAMKIVVNHSPGKVCFSSAFGQEDQVLADAIFSSHLNIEVFTLDTGRLFSQTYDLIDRTRERYHQPVKVYYPKTREVEAMVTKKGMHSFYESVENRKECCFIRKVEPLQRALKGAAVWVTGLRADQSDNRQSFKMLEWDEAHQVIKYNPLIDCTYDQIMAYLKERNVPYNTLHDQGYISIGCAPCTRAITKNEHPRAGRWWWEKTQKECGLHVSSHNE